MKITPNRYVKIQRSCTFNSIKFIIEKLFINTMGIYTYMKKGKKTICLVIDQLYLGDLP